MNNRSSELPSTTEKLLLPSSSLPLIQDSKTLTLFLLRKKSQKALTLLLRRGDEELTVYSHNKKPDGKIKGSICTKATP